MYYHLRHDLKFLLQFHSLISENFLILPVLLITLCFTLHFFSHNSLLSLIKIFNTKVDILYVDPNQICNFSKVLKYCKISFQIHFFQQLPLTSVMKNRVSCEHITRNLSEPGTVHIREWPRSFKAYLPQS